MAARTGLTDLDDACLFRVFSFLTPLPDLFNVAAAGCRRLRDLALDRRSWLVVSHTLHEPLVGIPRRYRQNFASLQDAIAASRPGDTIVLLPGEYQVSDVTVPWPVHIMGGGDFPGDVVLVCRKGADTVLDFRASGRLFNLSVRSHLGACVAHRRGKLSIEHCWLRCEAEGLGHLVAPIATLAASAQPHQAEQQPAQMDVLKAGARGGGDARANGLQGDDGVGPGLLSVVESKIQGGGMAVRLLGTGSLHSVRAIYCSQGQPLFFFHVDSAVPGTWQQPQRAQQQQQQQVHEGEAEGATPALPCPAGTMAGVKRKAPEAESQAAGAAQVPPPAPAPAPPMPAMPAWMQRPPFEPLAFQATVQQHQRQQQRGREQQQEQQGAQGAPLPLDKKAEQWSQRHAAALAARMSQ